MRMLVCPECREIILEGELRGNNKSCHACAVRTDESDLLVMGEENDSSASDTAKQPAAGELPEWAKSTQTWVNGTLVDHSPNEEMEKLANHPVNNALPLPDDPIPTIRSLEELKLAPDFSLRRYKDVDCLIYTSPGSSLLFWIGFIWLLIMMVCIYSITIQNIDKAATTSIFNMVTSYLVPVVFSVIGILITYAGLRMWKGKLYIDILPDSLAIREGVFHSGKGTIIQLCRETQMSILKKGTDDLGVFYALNLSDGITNQDIMMHKDYNKIKETYIMLKTMLAYHA